MKNVSKGLLDEPVLEVESEDAVRSVLTNSRKCPRPHLVELWKSRDFQNCRGLYSGVAVMAGNSHFRGDSGSTDASVGCFF